MRFFYHRYVSYKAKAWTSMCAVWPLEMVWDDNIIVMFVVSLSCVLPRPWCWYCSLHTLPLISQPPPWSIILTLLTTLTTHISYLIWGDMLTPAWPALCVWWELIALVSCNVASNASNGGPAGPRRERAASSPVQCSVSCAGLSQGSQSEPGCTSWLMQITPR